MSLINQMLKELDARRSDAGVGGAFGEQIRAVSERRQLHPAWWVALLLALSLVAVVAWVLLRPSVSDQYVVRAKLPLRLEVDLANASLVEPVPAGVVLAPPASVQATGSDVGQVEIPPTVDTGNPTPSDVPESSFLTPASLADKTVRVSTHPTPIPAPIEPRPKAAIAQARPASALADQSELEATPIAKQVRELTPRQRAENEFRKATLMIQQGRRADALVRLEQALQLDPKHGAARQTVIGVLLDAKRPDDALNHARAGLELDPRQAGLAMILARLQIEKNDLRAAIDTLEIARPYASERADYLAFLAALLQRDERHKQAADLYQVALEKAPQNGIWWMGLGISLQADRRNAEAVEAYGRAKETNSLPPDLVAFVDARLAQLK